MSRKARIHYEGALYHVIIRGNNREYILKKEKDKEEYLKKVTKYIDKYNGKLYAYVIIRQSLLFAYRGFGYNVITCSRLTLLPVNVS